MKKNFLVAMSIFLLLVICGCGKTLVDADEQSNVEEIREEEVSIDRTLYHWKTSEWIEPQVTDSKERIYIDSYSEGLIDYGEPEANRLVPYLDVCTEGSLFYVLDKREDSVGEGSSYYVDCYDAEAGKCTSVAYSVEELEGENETGVSTAFQLGVVHEEEYLVLRQKLQDAVLIGLEAVHLGKDGSIRKCVNLYEGMKEAQVYRAEKNSMKIMVDQEGHYYLTYLEYIIVLGENGELQACIGPKENWEQDYQYMSNKLLTDPDGEILVLTYYQKKSGGDTTKKDLGEACRIDIEGQQLVKVAHTGMEMSNACFSEDGYIYYTKTDGVYRWDLYTGQASLVFDVKGEGISENAGMTRIALGEDGKVCLYLLRSPIEMCTLSREKPTAQGEIKIVSLMDNPGELKAAVAVYSRRHPNEQITLEIQGEDEESERTRLMAELVSGNGPEAMYVSKTDMEILYEKGLLMDLSELLTQETRQAVFQGVLQCGQIDGKQMGFPMSAKLSAMLVNKNLWDQEGWNIRDILTLVKQQKLPNLETLIGVSATAAKHGFGKMGMLQALLLEDLENSGFVDMTNRSCSFDSEEFLAVLELIEGYGKLNFLDSPGELMEQGKMLAYVGDVSSADLFSQEMSELGTDYQCVGFPTNNGSGCYWDCDYYLVVNKAANCQETIEKLIEYIYSFNYQLKQDSPIRSDVYDRVEPDKNGTGYCRLYQGDGVYKMLRSKPDGSSWMPQYKELAAKSRPRSHKTDEIAEMIRQEAEALFEGDKDARTVAETIQNRVNLYLRENS